MEKLDVLVTVDIEKRLVHLRYGPHFTGLHLRMSRDEALQIAGYLIEAANLLGTANEEPKSF